MGWEGEYVDLNGQIRKLDAGSYLIVFEYTDGNDATEMEDTRFLPMEVANKEASPGVVHMQEFYMNQIAAANGYPSIKDIKFGDPVDLLTGALTWDYSDLYIGAQQDEFSFERHYNSAYTEAKDLGMGKGWSHSYLYRAEKLAGDVLVTLPEGDASSIRGTVTAVTRRRRMATLTASPTSEKDFCCPMRPENRWYSTEREISSLLSKLTERRQSSLIRMAGF